MIEAVILHAPGDSGAARRLVAHWPLGRAVVVDAATGVAATGGELLLCGLWSGADFEPVAEALMMAPRRSVIIAAAPAPAELQRLGLLIVEGGGEPAELVAKLARMAEELRRGIYPAPSAPPAEAPRKRRTRVKRERVAEAAPRRVATAAIDPAEEEQRRRRRRSAFGFAIGAGLGVAVFFGFAAPYLGGWLNRHDAPPPIVVGPRPAAAAEPLPIAPAAPAPVEVAPPAAEPAPIEAEPPLRGLLDEEAPS